MELPPPHNTNALPLPGGHDARPLDLAGLDRSLEIEPWYRNVLDEGPNTSNVAPELLRGLYSRLIEGGYAKLSAAPTRLVRVYAPSSASPGWLDDALPPERRRTVESVVAWLAAAVRYVATRDDRVTVHMAAELEDLLARYKLDALQPDQRRRLADAATGADAVLLTEMEVRYEGLRSMTVTGDTWAVMATYTVSARLIEVERALSVWDQSVEWKSTYRMRRP